MARKRTRLVLSRTAVATLGAASATALSTSWVRPESRASISSAAAASRGLPSIATSLTTMVSAPSTTPAAPAPSSASPRSALATAKRQASAAGASPGRGLSSTDTRMTRCAIPSWSSNSLRRGEAEAR